MNPECVYSFHDLFFAAYQRKPRADEVAAFMALSQAERNCSVQEWTRRAGWKTHKRKGTDGKIYLAFAPQDAQSK